MRSKRGKNMKKNEKRMNFLTLVLSCLAFVGLFFMTGCGNGCGQMPDVGTAELEGEQYAYVTIPMCGGCLTSGWGCSSFLWGEKCTLSTILADQSAENNIKILHCGETYYGDDCTGCGENSEYVYCGLGAATLDSKDMAGCYFGSSEGNDEYILGYYDGCACATKNPDQTFGYIAASTQSYVEMINEYEDYQNLYNCVNGAIAADE